MQTQRQRARTAGLLYFALVVLGILNLIVIPAQYVASGDPATTITNIQAMESVFRIGIIVGVLSDTVYIVLALAFYRMLAPVGRPAATLLVAFAAAGAGLGLVSAGAKLDVLTLLDAAPFLQAFTAEQVEAQASLSLRSSSNLLRVAELFWGLWLFPLGLLVHRSRFLPRALGILLMAGSVGYAINFFANILWPVYATTSLPMLIPLPAHIGEIGIMLWLVIVGTTVTDMRTRAGQPNPPT